MDDSAEYPVWNFPVYNGKIAVSITLSKDSKMETLCVLDTGAGLNEIRADNLSDEVIIRLEKNKQMINMRSENIHQLTKMCIVKFSMKVKGYSCLETFVIVQNWRRTWFCGPASSKTMFSRSWLYTCDWSFSTEPRFLQSVVRRRNNPQ